MTTPLREKLKKDLIAVANEVSNLWLHHDIFWKIADAFNNSPKVLETGGHLINWFKNSYIEAGSVALRRQLDRDTRSISLMNVLLEIERDHASFTKEDFQAMHAFRPGGVLHNAEKWKRAGETFDQLFGHGGAHLDQAMVLEDIELLKTASASIKEQVDKEIAHKDRKGMTGSKATGLIFQDCIKHLEDLTLKYWELLYDRLPEQIHGDLGDHIDQLFTFAWRPKEYSATNVRL